MMTEPLNIAVWGLGKHALNRILPAIKGCQHLSLYGVYTRDQSVLSRVGEHYQCKAFSSEAELLNDSHLDVIYLSTPIGLHYSQGKSVLTANKHLWCEKPLATHYRHACELIELAREKALSVFEGFMYLYHPQFLHLNDYIENNHAQLDLIESRFTIPMLEKPGFRHNPDLGGSALYDIGCYPLSLVQALMGKQNSDIKYCRIKRDAQLGVDVRGKVLLEYESGVQASLDWGMGLGYTNSVSVLGAEGRVFADKIFSKPDEYEASVVSYDQYGNQIEQKSSSCNQFTAMFDAFAEKVTNLLSIEDEYNRMLGRTKLLENINKYANSRFVTKF
ncbi:MAG: NDP-hexose-3-ketoreductase [Enterobacterales bacterium]|jgi:NDP-hexose-3-ketoreductase